MSHDPNTPWGACLEQLNKLEAALTTITTGLKEVSDGFPVDALRQIHNKANLITEESDSASQQLEAARQAFDAGSFTLKATTAVISREHEAFQQVPESMAKADSEISDAKEREVAVKEISSLGSAALADIGQKMTAERAAVERTGLDCVRVAEVIYRMRGAIGG
jgi:hypothetical protein